MALTEFSTLPSRMERVQMWSKGEKRMGGGVLFYVAEDSLSMFGFFYSLFLIFLVDLRVRWIF